MDWLAKRVQGTGDEPAIHSSACPFLDGLNIAWRNGHALYTIWLFNIAMDNPL